MERGASAECISSVGESFEDWLADQRAANDPVVTRYQDVTSDLDAFGGEQEALDVLTDIQAQIDGLVLLRTRVDQLDIPIVDAFAAYTELNKDAILLLPLLGKRISDAPTANAVQRHALYMSTKDLAGLERATGAVGFNLAASGGGVFPTSVLQRFQSLVAKQSALFDA